MGFSMRSFSIQTIKLRFNEGITPSHDIIIDSLYSGNKNRDLDKQELLIAGNDEDFIDFKISWFEERILKGIIRNNTVEDLAIEIQREAYCKLCLKQNVVLAIGLNRQYSKFLKMLWPNQEFRPSFSEVRFNLVKLMNSHLLTDHIQFTLFDLTLDDLPIEKIPAASVQIKKCNLPDLIDLVFGTNAVIKKFTAQPINEEYESITLSNRGSIKICGDFFDWQVPLYYSEQFLRKIGLMEG